MSSNRLLIMDDDIGISTLFAEVASGIGFEVDVLNHPKTFFEKVEQFDPDVLLLDLQMPGSDGIELLRRPGHERWHRFPPPDPGRDSRRRGLPQGRHGRDIMSGSTIRPP